MGHLRGCRVLFITGFDMRHRLSALQLSWLLPGIALLVCLSWLTSLEKYLGVRYHFSLEAALPPSVAQVLFAPSRWLDERIRSGGARPLFRLNWPSSTGVLEYPAPINRTPEPPQLQNLPEPLPPGEFLATLSQQKLAPGVQRILLAGDSMMQGIAPLFMREMTRLHPDWEVHDLSRQSTGLTVRRYFDWPTRMMDEMDAKSLTLLVVFLGPNDPWDMLVDGQRHLFPSPGWALNYALRVDEVLAAAVERQVRVIWLGLPAMQDGRIREGAVLQNYIFHARAAQWRTDYLATEPLIGLLSEPFQKFKLKEDGQRVNLRANDGIHLTPSGLRLINQALLAHIEQARQP
jgi:hypothetical protein